MKQRLVHVCTALVATVLVVLGLAPVAFAATTPGVQVVSADPAGSVTVHVLDNTGKTGPLSQGDGSEIQDTSDLGNPIEGVRMGARKVGELVQVTEEAADGTVTTSTMYAIAGDVASSFGWAEALNEAGNPTATIDDGGYYLLDAAQLNNLLIGPDNNPYTSATLYKKVPGGWVSSTTTNEGVATYNDLSGLYLFIATALPANVTVEVAPFFASVPTPVAGAQDSGAWSIEVHAYPKVNTAGAIELVKEVKYADADDERYTTSMSVRGDKTLTYRITATIPAGSNVKNLDAFEIGDIETAGLDIDTDSIQVASTGFSLTPDDDYTTMKNTGSFSVALTPKGCTSVVADATARRTIVITYNATVHQSMQLGTNVDNVATLMYSYANNSEDATVEATATVFTYGIDLTKTFQDATEYQSGAKFVLYTSEDCAEDSALYVTGAPGSYWVCSSATPDDGVELEVAHSGDNASGDLVISGLEAGTYYLKEIAAPDGYSVLRDPIEIVVEAGKDAQSGVQVVAGTTAKVNDTDATIDVSAAATDDTRGLVQLTVENVKDSNIFGFLPATGDTGTFLLVAVGVGLVCLAVVFMSKGRRDSRRA